MKLRNKAKPKQNKQMRIDYDTLYLYPEEITNTEELLFKYAQSKEFSKEISNLSEGLEVQKTSKIKKLIPIMDEETGLLRHKSRIVGYKPIILPKDHQITTK